MSFQFFMFEKEARIYDAHNRPARVTRRNKKFRFLFFFLSSERLGTLSKSVDAECSFPFLSDFSQISFFSPKSFVTFNPTFHSHHGLVSIKRLFRFLPSHECHLHIAVDCFRFSLGSLRHGSFGKSFKFHGLYLTDVVSTRFRGKLNPFTKLSAF